MRQKEIKIETGRLGFRAKTWAVLLILVAQAANFGASCSFWYIKNDRDLVGLVGWLVITTLAALLGVYSEGRRKPLRNAFTLRIRTRDGDQSSELTQTYETQRLDAIDEAAGDLSPFIGSARS